MKPSELSAIQSKFPLSQSTLRRNSVADPVHPVAHQECEPDIVHEPVAEDALQGDGQVFRTVRLTCLRCRLLDDDNPWIKPFIDALKEAGIIVDDSKKWCQVECFQRQVLSPCEEGILIEVL